MNRKELEQAFFNAFYDMDYFCATKLLGKMEAAGFVNGRFRYYEMLLLFEQGEYSKIRNQLRNQKTTMEEKELYLASLVQLKKIDEFEENLKRPPQISFYGYAYICYLLRKFNTV